MLFAQDWAWYRGVHETRYASTGIFDGRYKYCRYYGVGGGTSVLGQRLGAAKTYDYDAAFEDHEHELYDLEEDPHEIVNLAGDPARADEVRQRFAALREIEATAYGR